MVISKTVLESISIIYLILAISGIVIISVTAYLAMKKRDDDLIRARAFLSESFLKDIWTLILISCFFLIIHAAFELNEILGFSIEESISELMKETTELGLIASIVLSAYKWFQLMNPK